MNDNVIIKAMANIDEKYIREAEDVEIFRRRIIRRQKRRFAAFVLLVICFIALCMWDGGSESSAENDPLSYETVGCAHMEMKINEASAVAVADMDVKITHIAVEGSFGSSYVKKYYENAGIDYDNIISAVYDDYEISALYTMDSQFIGGVKHDEYFPHDYVFAFEGSDGKYIEIKICPYEEILSDCIIISDEKAVSEIATEEVIITHFAGTYYADFDINGTYYSIEGRNITDTELADTIINLISPGGLNE